jgi:hypothetical protein
MSSNVSEVTTSAYVMLRGGLTVRVEAVDLLLDLERRGVRLTRDGDSVLLNAPAAAVTDSDRASIKQHKVHLLALLDYCEGEVVQ